MNRIWTFPLLVFTALALSASVRPPAPRPDPAARVIMQYLTVVKADGSAEFHFILKFSQEQLEEIRDAGQVSEDELCKESSPETEDPALSYTQEKHGEEIWCTHVTRLDSLADLSDELEDVFDSLTVGRLETIGGTFYLDLSWEAFPCTSPDPSVFTCEWAVKAPGKVGENNATRVEGNTLTWDMMEPGTPLRFEAQSASGGGSDSTLVIVAILLGCGCCSVLLLAAGIVLFFVLRKRKQPAENPAETRTPPQAPPSSPADTIIL